MSLAPAIAPPRSGLVYTRLNDRYILVRALGPADARALQCMVRGLSTESRYRRFHGHISGLAAADATLLTHVDQDLHVAIGAFATTAIGGVEGPMVGEARFVRAHRDEHVAELAIAVTDGLQRRGLGTLLLRELIPVATAQGIHKLVARSLSTSGHLIALLGRFGEIRTTAPNRIELTLTGASTASHG